MTFHFDEYWARQFIFDFGCWHLAPAFIQFNPISFPKYFGSCFICTHALCLPLFTDKIFDIASRLSLFTSTKHHQNVDWTIHGLNVQSERTASQSIQTWTYVSGRGNLFIHLHVRKETEKVLARKKTARQNWLFGLYVQRRNMGLHVKSRMKRTKRQSYDSFANGQPRIYTERTQIND